MSKQSLKALVVHLKANQFIKDAIRKDMLKHGLSMSEFMVLEVLYHKGPQTIQFIAKKVLLTSGTMTYVINQLEKKNKIIRSKSNEDLRISKISLSAKGKQLMDEVFKQHEKMIEEMFSPLSEKQLEQWIEFNKLIGIGLEKKALKIDD